MNMNKLKKALKTIDPKEVIRINNELQDLKKFAYDMKIGEEFELYYPNEPTKVYKRIK